MRKFLPVFIGLFYLSGCASLLLNDNWDVIYDSDPKITIQVTVPEDKNGIIVQPVQIVKATFQLIDPVSNIQTYQWTPASNDTMTFYSYRNGNHGVKITDIDSENRTNVFSTNFNFQIGYNYRISVSLGGSSIAIETNLPPETINPLLALVLYSDTLGQNVVWGVDINTNQSPSSPNVLSFVNSGAGEGIQCFKIKVNSNYFEVNFLRYPLVTYLDLSAYAGGTLKFMVKATTGLSVGIHMAANYDIMEHLSNGNYGFYTNNTWCRVSIPMSNYIQKGLNLATLYGWVKFYGGSYEGVVGGEEYYIDQVLFYKQ